MSDNEKPPDLAGLDARLREARARQDAEAGTKERGAGLGIAFRVATELVAGLVVGAGIGWLLDFWLGTRPWLMIVFFLLGAAAGMMNVFRLVSRQGHAVGWKKPRGDDGQREP